MMEERKVIMANTRPKSIVDKNGKATTVHVKQDDSSGIRKRLDDLKTSYVPAPVKIVRPTLEFSPRELTVHGLDGFASTDDDGNKTYVILDKPRPIKDKREIEAFEESKREGVRPKDAEGMLVTEVDEEEFDSLSSSAAFIHDLKDHNGENKWVDSVKGILNHYDSPYIDPNP
jgi:uncharacterized protein YrzB (UPF0473 family)